jgi:hypothetical protein
MVSDVLHDAAIDIDSYLDNDLYATVYTGSTRDKIIAVRKQMDALRGELDTLPPQEKKCTRLCG